MSTIKKHKFIMPKDKVGIHPSENDLIKKFGWFAHYIFGEERDKFPFGVNINTHGILENFNHPDLQICIALPYKNIHGILWAAFRLIEAGDKFESGKEYDRVLTGYKVMAIKARENNRDVIRIVLPAEDGTYTGVYAEQLIKTGREDIN